MSHWQMQQAKQQFCELIKKATEEGPQQVTYRGEEKAWVLSTEDYHKLIKKRDTLIDFFQKSPHRNIRLKLERRNDLPRDIKL